MGFIVFLMIAGTGGYLFFSQMRRNNTDKEQLQNDHDDIFGSEFNRIAVDHKTGRVTLADERGRTPMTLDDVLSVEIWEEREDRTGRKSRGPFDPGVDRSRVHEIQLVVATTKRREPFRIVICETPIVYGAKWKGMAANEDRVIQGIETAQRYQAVLAGR